jgi:5'-nucleotidase
VLPARVILDMDGILADLLTPWLARYNADYGDQLTVAEVTAWDLHTIVRPACGRAVYQYLRDPDLFRHLPLIPGAQEAVDTLRRRGWDPVIVTAAGSTQHAAKAAWLHEHFPAIPADHLVFTAGKTLIPAGVFIDDAPHNLIPYRAAYPTAQVLTLAYPYNATVPVPRFPSWAALVAAVAPPRLPAAYGPWIAGRTPLS